MPSAWQKSGDSGQLDQNEHRARILERFRTVIFHFRSITYCLASFVHDFTSDKHSFPFWIVFFPSLCMHWLTFISQFFYTLQNYSNVGFFPHNLLFFFHIFETMVGKRWNCWLMWLNGICALIVSRPNSNDQWYKRKTEPNKTHAFSHSHVKWA